MSRQLVCFAACFLCFGAFSSLVLGQVVFPAPGDEVWELVSETGVVKASYSDRCCAVDGRNRLCVCNTGYHADLGMRRWDGTLWWELALPDKVYSVCAGPDNIVLLGEELNLGYVRDDGYAPIEMAYFYSDCQWTTSFEDDTWVLSSGPEDGLQCTNWRLGGGGWLSSPGTAYAIVYEIDAWGPESRWAVCYGDFYYQENGADWRRLAFESAPTNYVWIAQVEPYGPRRAWAVGEDGDLYHHVDDDFYDLFEKGYPLPNGPVLRITLDRNLGVWCALGNGQIARFDGESWAHYTCDFLSGNVQDMAFDHFENLYVITDEMIAKMCVGWHGIEFDFWCMKETYTPGEAVGITALARNPSWTGILTDLYIAYQNKQTGELLFLPGPSREVRPVIPGLWVKRRAPVYIGYIDIGPAPDAPGEYAVLIGFVFQGRLDLFSSHIETYDITVIDSNH
ncbi:MAG: hypothetical protein JW759_00125 [Candidatus Coatesbacteria bacterium]|nr:hypothetical protein [Candidatus Coatesbacteria bacterium]